MDFKVGIYYEGKGAMPANVLNSSLHGLWLATLRGRGNKRTNLVLYTLLLTTSSVSDLCLLNALTSSSQDP